MKRNVILVGDVLEQLSLLPDGCVHMCVTSPPYWGLRDYGVEGQLGLEKTPEEYIEKMVSVFAEVKRVLRDDSTLWLNMGDSYATSKTGNTETIKNPGAVTNTFTKKRPPNLKHKDLCGIPWMLAFALRSDGWYLRQDIIWSKPNPMPESVTDRCTKAHEYIFLLTKKPKYFYDAEAIKEPGVKPEMSVEEYAEQKIRGRQGGKWYPNELTEDGHKCSHAKLTKTGAGFTPPGGRNKRSVWTIPTYSYSEAHFATFPPKLIKPCIKAGTSEKGCCSECGAPWVRVTEKDRQPTRPGEDTKTEGKTPLEMGNRDPQRHVTETKTIGWELQCDCNAPIVPCIVFDPFMGAGTTGLVSRQLGRDWLGIELNPEYAEMATKRIRNYAPLFEATT